MRITILSILALTVIVTLSGCSQTNNLTLSDGDAQALNKIYEASSWSYNKSRLHIQVYENNGLEIEFDGEAFHKNTQSSTPLMIPLVLVKELPQYFKATDEKNQELELQSYKIKNGLWSIVAVIPTSNLSQPIENQPSATIKPALLRLKILLVSSTFNGGLPILIPAGQSRSVVDVALTLPNNYTFTSLTIDKSGLTDDSQQLVLTELPPTVTDGAVRAATRLPSSDIQAWDFSSITYASGFLPFSPYLFYFLLAISLVTIVVFLRYYSLKRRAEKEIERERELKRREEEEIELAEKENEWKKELKRRAEKEIEREKNWNELMNLALAQDNEIHKLNHIANNIYFDNTFSNEGWKYEEIKEVSAIVRKVLTIVLKLKNSRFYYSESFREEEELINKLWTASQSFSKKRQKLFEKIWKEEPKHFENQKLRIQLNNLITFDHILNKIVVNNERFMHKRRMHKRLLY